MDGLIALAKATRFVTGARMLFSSKTSSTYSELAKNAGINLFKHGKIYM
jgi:hypothetical protein